MNCISKVYADLIRKGKKALKDVPTKLRNEVQQFLEQDVKEND